MIGSIAIVGMGALGLLYADQLTSGLKDNGAVTFIMDRERLARHRNDVYTVNGEKKNFRMTAAEDAAPADLLIVAVKYNELQQALDTMEKAVGDSTIILSVMNGITSEKIIASRYGMDRIVYTVAQGMDAMREGTSLRYTKCGNLHIGAVDAKMEEKLAEVRELFERAGVPHVVEKDIMYRLWFKFMLNVGINQISMAYDVNYGQATEVGSECNRVMTETMREVVRIAAAKGVTLTEKDLGQCLEIERTLDPEGYPSMAQDRKAKRRSEVDMFAGEVIRMGRELGIPTPYNEDIMKKVLEIEKNY